MFERLTEKGLTILLGVILLFLLINFNRELGLIYIGMLIVDYMIIDSMRTLRFPMEKDTSRLMDILYGVAAYLTFTIISSFTMSAIDPQAIFGGILGALQKLAATTPILSSSPILTFIGWGIIIPIIETRFFFGRLMEIIAEKTKTTISLLDVKSWFVFILVSAVFALFHISARAITATQFDEIALLMTFIFGLMSCIIVVWLKELSAATYFHIMNNSVGVAIKLGLQPVMSILGIPTPV